MNIATIFFTSFCLIIAYYFFKSRLRRFWIKPPTGSKRVPVVDGALPFVGHGFSFSKDIVGYIKQCQKRYGDVFRLKIFRTDMIVVCDRALCKEFFAAKEQDMSLYGALDRLYFGNAFSDDPNSLPLIIKMVKSSITIKFDEFAKKILDQATTMVARIRKKSADVDESRNMHDIAEEMIRFVAFTSASCFIGLDLSEDFYLALQQFTHLLNKIVVLTYFFPKWLLCLVLGPTLSNYRKKMTKLLEPEIETYRQDKFKQDSLIFRKGVDYVDSETGGRGTKLSNQQIADIVVCLLYVSSENTALGLSACLVDLAMHPNWWSRVKESTAEHLKNGSVTGLFNDRILNAAVMESARINTHIFPLNRKPLHENMTLGEWFVGDAECIGLCEPMLLTDPVCSRGFFKDAEKYDPSRFLEGGEKTDPHSLTTWGAGVHLCPGKGFAVYEIKAAVALMINGFEKFEIPKDHLGELDYFSPSAFAERRVRVILRPLPKPITFAQFGANEKTISLTTARGKKIHVEHLDQGGWLLKGLLSRDEQIDFYEYTTSISKDSTEAREIRDFDKPRAIALTYHNLVYTGKSNCSVPEKWYHWADELFSLLQENRRQLKMPKVSFKANSLYAQLFSLEATMAKHKDEYVNWGISISLGASAKFSFGNTSLTLNSGDVLIADFSQIEHAVDNILSDTQPAWFTDEIVSTFNKARCSIQIRDLTTCNETPNMTQDQFEKMLDTFL